MKKRKKWKRERETFLPEHVLSNRTDYLHYQITFNFTMGFLHVEFSENIYIFICFIKQQFPIGTVSLQHVCYVKWSIGFFFFLAEQHARYLVPQTEIKPLPPAVGAQSLNHWTTREVPCIKWILSVFQNRENHPFPAISIMWRPQLWAELGCYLAQFPLVVSLYLF